LSHQHSNYMQHGFCFLWEPGLISLHTISDIMIGIATGNHIPIIALTARTMKEEQKQIMSHGFDGYIAKPLKLSVLIEEMKRALEV
jgi:CheY-like chemotaxis protein